jgi:OFA family oxalate/formate antiporter-like MFS transporter
LNSDFFLALKHWRTTYFILGLAITTILCIGSIFIKKPDSDTILPQPKITKEQGGEDKDHTTAEMIKSASFWKFYVLIALLSSVGSSVISFAKDVSLRVGAPESIAILLVGVLSVCNGFGRIISGWLFDNIGSRKTMLLANAVAIIAPVSMLIAVRIKSVPLVVAGLIAAGLSYGSVPPISSGFTSSFYGAKHFALNFSIANTMLLPASFSATIAGMLINVSGSYIPVFIMLLCLSAIGLLINISLKKV